MSLKIIVFTAVTASIIHWNPNIVEHLRALAKQYREQGMDAVD